MIGPAEFIDRIFTAAQGHAVCITHPDSFVKENKTVNFFRNYRYRKALFDKPNSWYVCVSTVTAVPRGGKIRRRMEDLQEAMVLVLDDVGTKSAVPPVEPSYILETSKGNFQYGYILKPWDVSTGEGYAMYDGSLRALANAGYNDPGAIGGYRAVRVPGSLHKTGFVCRCRAFHPELYWALPDLMEQLGVEPLKQRVNRPVSMSINVANSGKPDKVLQWLGENNYLIDYGAPDWQPIICPWWAAHSDPDDQTSYYSLNNSRWKCFHGGCKEKKTKDFILWAVSAGMEPPHSVTAPTHSQYRQIRELLNDIY